MIAGKRLFAIYQDRKNSFSFSNPSILWDLKPATETLPFVEMQLDYDAVISFAISQGLENYKKELLKSRERDADFPC